MDLEKDRKEKRPLLDNNSQINLVVSNTDQEEDAIDLGNVLHNMKVKSRVFAWVLILCLLVGICAPLLLYQFNKPMLKVSSVVTLNYEVPTENGYQKVSNLLDPNGNDLDLNQISSAYVLQNALTGLSLSYTPTLSNLRDNISVERILTEESYQNQELLKQMADNKSNDMYEQYRQTEIKYTNRFVVTLTNGFGDEDDRVRHEVKDAELKEILNRILSSYNDYLVRTYADMKLPENELVVIDVMNLDALENLESLRTASEDLYSYCANKPSSVRTYRSYRDGQNLEDWMRYIRTNQENTIDYLYSYVYSSRYAQDRDTLIAGYQYQLREAQAKLDTANENIAYISGILSTYQNDEILLTAAGEENAARRTTALTTTDYYNNLYLEQMRNYASVEALEEEIAELQDKISNMVSGDAAASSEDMKELITEELNRTVETFRSIYNQVVSHMEEIQQSGFYTMYAEHTEAQGKLDNFLKANVKKMLIGAVVGALLACGLWFLAALAPEFRKNRPEEAKKEAKRA